MRIGPRTWKTGIAVAVAIGLCRMIGLEHPVFAGVAAIICMQPTVTSSFRRGVERMQATVVGAAFALGALVLLDYARFLLPIKPLVIGATVLLVMVTTIKLKWLDSLVLAAATVVVVMVLPKGENMYLYAASRTVVTLMGVVVATLLNALVFPPDYSESIRRKVARLLEASCAAYRQSVEAFCRRDRSLAESVLAALSETEPLLDQAATEKQWIAEEAAVLKMALRSRYERSLRFGELVEHVASVRESARRISGMTVEALARTPKYADEEAVVYDVVWELAQIGFGISEGVCARLRGEREAEGAPSEGWTEAADRELVRAVRAAYRAPRDIFPLVEVAVAAFEVRWTTRVLAKLAEMLQ